MYSSCLKEFGTDCLVHVVLTLSWPYSLFFEVQLMKVHVTSLGCQRRGMFLFISFQTQPYPQYFYPGENKTKVADDKTSVLTAVQGSCSKSQDFPSIATSTSTLQSCGLSCPLHWPCSNQAGSADFLSSSFTSRSSSTTKMRHVTYDDDLQIRGDFVFLSKALLQFPLAGVSKCSCQALPSRWMP